MSIRVIRQTNRRIRWLFFLILCGFIGLSYHQDALATFLSLPPDERTYLSTPTYEYHSLYRQHADKALEAQLNSQLLSLERFALSQSPSPTDPSNLTIWQLASSRSQARSWAPWAQQWAILNRGININPSFNYHLFRTPSSADSFITPHYKTISSILSSHPELQSHLLPYLILYYHGGIYISLDTYPRTPLSSCNPISQSLKGNISLVVGVDIDEPYFSPSERKRWGWQRGFGFSTDFLFAPKRFDPFLRQMIIRSITHTLVADKRGWKGKEAQGEISGGGMMVDVIFDGLSENLGEDHWVRDRDAGLERRVSWKKFRRLRGPLWIDGSEGVGKEETEGEMRGLGVLNIDIWGNGQRHSNARGFENEQACGNHVWGKNPPVKLTAWQKLFG